MNDTEFQKKVLDGTEALAKQQTELVGKYDQLDKTTKAAFEDLTKLKNQANNAAAIMAAIQKVQIELRNERRMAFGNPVQRIQNDEQKRTLFNAMVRRSTLKNDERLPDVFAKALGETSSPGSIGIVTQLASDIYDTLATYGVWNTFQVRRLGTRVTKLPVKTVRPVANWIVTESSQISDDTNKAGTSVDLTVLPLAVLLNVSRELIDDSEYDVTADVMDDFAEACAYRLDWSALAADGTADATDGSNTGVFSGGTAAAAAGGNTTTEVLELEDFTKCLATVDSAVLSRPCKWWVNPQILIKMLSVKDGNKRPLFLTALEAPAASGIGSILGYPVMTCHAAPATNVAGEVVAVFGDPAGMVVGIRNDFSFEASDHFKWDYYMRSFRGIARAGVKIRRAQAFAKLTLAAQ